MRRGYALMHGHNIYTLQPCGRDLKPFRFVGFCDGDRCGFFKTKKAFEEWVGRQPLPASMASTEQREASYCAEAWSTFEGRRLLNAIHSTNGGRS